MSRRVSPSPERQTLIEEFVGLVRLPYPASCLLLAALLGPVGQVLTRYLDGYTLADAVGRTLSLDSVTPTLAGVVNQSTFFAFLFYGFYIIRYMRLKLVESKPGLVALFPHGAETFHVAFARVSRARPPLLVILLFAPLVLGLLVTSAPQGAGLHFLIYQAISTLTLFAIFVTFVWVYYSSLRGLHMIGKEPLKLKPFYEDNMQGTRPLGSLSLSLALSYFGGLFIVIVGLSASPDPLALAIVILVTLLGVILFFLPLTIIHRRMLQERRRLQSTLQSDVLKLTESSGDPGSTFEAATLKDLHETLTDVKKLIALQMTKHDVDSIPTWPFDTGILGSLTVVVLTAFGIVIARYIQIALKIG